MRGDVKSYLETIRSSSMPRLASALFRRWSARERCWVMEWPPLVWRRDKYFHKHKEDESIIQALDCGEANDLTSGKLRLTLQFGEAFSRTRRWDVSAYLWGKFVIWLGSLNARRCTDVASALRAISTRPLIYDKIVTMHYCRLPHANCTHRKKSKGL